MTPSGAVTGVVANAERRIGSKITARAGTLCVDYAANLLPDPALQSNTARRRFIGAAHAHQRGSQRNGQFHRHTRMLRRRQIGTVKIHSKCSTTGATGKTGKIRHESLMVPENQPIVSYLPPDGKPV
jgi:hypothetical protein